MDFRLVFLSLRSALTSQFEVTYCSNFNCATLFSSRIRHQVQPDVDSFVGPCLLKPTGILVMASEESPLRCIARLADVDQSESPSFFGRNYYRVDGSPEWRFPIHDSDGVCENHIIPSIGQVGITSKNSKLPPQ